jgi:hypothetical protein
MGFMARGGMVDHEKERKVSIAAQSLGAGVQSIVLAAKNGGSEWKSNLLQLLGDEPLVDDDDDSYEDQNPSDITILLENSSCKKFVLRCVENELAPNLIHCLRLLRVLELQHVASQQRRLKEREKQSQGEEQNDNDDDTFYDEKVSKRAAEKVSKLLCLLCGDASVGEQLRPHLFGLLALSGASYPASGVHVSKAASEVICAYSEHCLSNSLVWYLHDKKMIVHMVDDIKELCGMTPVSSSTASVCLYGKEAEEAGLWNISITTVVALVTHSCNFSCVELLKDFDKAGGYQVLHYAIENSGNRHTKQLLELVMMLARCKTSAPKAPVSGVGRVDEDKETAMLVTNPAAFDIVEDLVRKTLPLLVEYDSELNGEKPDVEDDENMRGLVLYSMNSALKGRFANGATPPPENGDQGILDELLVTTLQMYSDHPENYAILEERHRILSFYLVAFPTFEDGSLKVMILKTLEFVLTGVAGNGAIIPTKIACQVFFTLCKTLLNGLEDMGLNSQEEAAVYNKLLVDAYLICRTFEKLLEFDSRVGQIMIEGDVLSANLPDVLENFAKATEALPSGENDTFQVNDKNFRLPRESTSLDRVFAAVCRVLRLVVAEGSGLSLPRDSLSDENDSPMASNVNTLILTAIHELGDEAAVAALRVFDTKMSSQSSAELMSVDMGFIMHILNHFAEMSGRLNGLSVFDDQLELDIDTHKVMSNIILREMRVYKMLKDVLERSALAQDAFRLQGGFEAIIRTVGCLAGSVERECDEDDEEEIEESESLQSCRSSLAKLLEITFGVLSAACQPHSRQKSPSQHSALLATGDMFTEESLTSPAASNMHYMNQRFFLAEYAGAVASTGVLDFDESATLVVNLILAYIDPGLKLQDKEERKKAEAAGDKVLSIRNPNASRLLLSAATYLPLTESGIILSKRALDEMLRLCAPDRITTTLSQIASCGLCYMVTNRKEFTPMLEDRTHHLYSRFVLLLRRIAAFSMSYMDFVSMLRCIAGPILKADSKDNRIRLPVVSSSVRTYTRRKIERNRKGSELELWEEEEADFCIRLETLSVIAERGDRVARCELGGDSLNNVPLYQQKAKIEDLFSAMADNGKLRFIHIESIDSSAMISTGLANAGTVSPFSNTGERIWTPLAITGFSYATWIRIPRQTGNDTGNIFLLDISSPYGSHAEATGASIEYLSIWFDVKQQRFTVLSSTSARREPTWFPVSPLRQGVWHHVVVTYLPAKRGVIARKATLALFVDGRPLEADVRLDNISLPPNASVYIGVPNPYLAVNAVVKGSLPLWDLGPTLMLSTIISNLDATAFFMSGPDFPGAFWGDRPQRLSLAATGTAAFAMLAESGEQGSVAGALRRREVHRLEAAGTVNRMRLGPGNRQGSDSLSVLGLLYMVLPENLVFGYIASSAIPHVSKGTKGHYSRRILNMGRVNASNGTVSADAIVYGVGSVASPYCFADNVQWVGGPSILMPIVNAARSTRSLALALRLIRESVHRHPPNLEMLQLGGGYRMLGILLSQKKIMDAGVIDQCFALAVHGFMPHIIQDHEVNMMNSSMSSTLGVPQTWPYSERWVFTDLDAMKYLLLNHQVWDMKNSGPDLPLRLLSFFNGLVAQDSAQKAFNSRRLHMLGIVRWTLHLMLEAAELFTLGEIGVSQAEQDYGDGFTPPNSNAAAAMNSGWYCVAPLVASTSVGGDPDNAMLQGCKTLLRRVLTFMLTPSDLEAIAEATVYSIAITTSGSSGVSGGKQQGAAKLPNEMENPNDAKLMPGAVARVYLLRLIEELVVDGVNEIIASAMESSGEGDAPAEPTLQAHIGGGASTNQSYLTTAMMRGSSAARRHPKHQQAQAFLSAFAGVLTPVWFACLLEGCHEEASASAVFRLMILMLQSSPMFAEAFEAAGGFAPLVLSIPKYSTCPSIAMSMLSQLLQVHILHLPCLGVLDADLLCEIFDSETEAVESIGRARSGSRASSSDPSCGIFALLAECLGRNIQLAPFDNDVGWKARQTNKAVLQLLSQQHQVSKAFRDFCRTSDFLEPLAQALCLVHDEKLQRMQQQDQQGETKPSGTFEPEGIDCARPKATRRGSLKMVPTDVTPTERFVGRPDEGMGSSGIGMVHLLHLVLQHAVVSGPFAAPLVNALFRSFPIHASPEQVEAFHLVLIEHCRDVVESSLETGESIAIANCIGVSSVILDRLMAGFFTSEPILEATKMIIATLKCLTNGGAGSLGSAELTLLAADAAHLARLICITALQRCRPMSTYDEGDDELKTAVLGIIAANIESLLIVPTGGGQQTPRKQTLMGSSNSGTSLFPTPPPSSRTHILWKSTSLARSGVKVTYQDLSVAEEPDTPFIVGMMDQIHSILLDTDVHTREQAVSIVVALLQKRRTVMSKLLIVEVPRGDRMETVDIMNRGGFGALLVAHEAATVSSNFSIIPQRSAGRSVSGGNKGTKSKYGSFFEWLDGNESKVEIVFHSIHVMATKYFAFAGAGAPNPEDAIENEQKSMLLKLTTQDSSDRTILGGLERAELGQRCYDKTAATHILWKRQGFDDLASGAMKWKILLRQLKGSCSIWEKVPSVNGGEDSESYFSPKLLLKSMVDGDRESTNVSMADEARIEKEDVAAMENVRRWKLDLTEGYERQRRRLLPNYEFHSLYNVDELADIANLSSEMEDEQQDSGGSLTSSFAPPQSIEATTALLKDLNLKKAERGDDEDDEYDMDVEDDNATAMTTATSQSSMGEEESSHSEVQGKETQQEMNANQSETDLKSGAIESTRKSDLEDAFAPENVDASSYDLITGLLKAGDWPERSYNVQRCTGLEVRKALLLWCREAIYIIDGFEQTDGEGLEGRIKRVEKEQSTFSVTLRTQKSTASQEKKVAEEKEQSQEQDASDEIAYQHRSQRLALSDLYSVFRRRHELQQVALEFYDIHRSGTLVAFSSHGEREEVLASILSSPLPNSIFASSGTSINYRKFMTAWKSKIVSQWQNGKMTNFDFLMHMNSLAGRTYNDLTQYPVFPWVIADYESEELDLDDPKTFRDLSKPMGAQNEDRAQAFRDRYEALEDSYQYNDGVPPFHYGTHYSCAAYVLYYLMRLEPFSRLALTLQGGHFDVADRLFHNIGSSWKSASCENVQDVRELIPEFFYLPEFLGNSNNFDFGVTQGGKTIHDVTLPPWAHGDAKRFIRLNRQALESQYVSKNLHQWVDLVFGYKQRGAEAVQALNVFMHVTYEGEVDLATLEDPIQRASTLAQIQNFGQTPSRLERKPFPPRYVVNALRDDKNLDFGSFTYLAPLTPPFCVVGAPQRSFIRPVLTDHCKVGMVGQMDSSVGDMCLVKGQIVGVGRSCVLIIPSKMYCRFGGPNNGVSVHVASPSTRYREVNKIVSVHDGMHRSKISAAAASLNGQWLVTGCIDSTVRVWKYDGQSTALMATLCGHEGGRITCIDVSTVFGMIVTGSSNGDCLLWDLRTLTFMRRLRHPFLEEAANVQGSIGYNPAVSVSINHKNGYIVTLVGSHLSMFDINGSRLASISPGRAFGSHNRPTRAIATDCPEWMEQGIVAVTGHHNGEIRLWSLDHDHGEFIMRHVMPDNPHSCPITALRVTGDRQETLLIGDKSGRVTVCKTVQLESLNSEDLATIVEEVRSKVKISDAPLKLGKPRL